MGENSKIEWTDHTFNPWIGCTKVSPACDHCYAERVGFRLKVEWGGERRRTSESNWWLPFKWNAKAERDGIRRRVFCASLADVFDNQVPDEWRADLWRLIGDTPHLDWLLLTKRPQNISKMFRPGLASECWGNVWLGTTVENEEEAERRIPHLLRVPAAVHFLSCEPLLSDINLEPYFDGIDWVIAGGESGPSARPAHPNWVRSLREQCRAYYVPFFFKQWGDWHSDALLSTDVRTGLCPPPRMKIGKKKSGALLDGREWREFPLSHKGS